VTDDLEPVKRAIASVVADGGGLRKTGTAFYIGGKFVLTALHVIADTRAGGPVFLPSVVLTFYGSNQPCTAKVHHELWSATDDWAVLECESSPDANPIVLGSEPRPNAAWSAFGYPEMQRSGMTICGTVSDPRLRQPSGSGEVPFTEVRQLYCREAAAGLGAPLHGFSGAPCLVDGAAVGILRSTLNEELYDGQLQRLLFTQAGTVYASPASSVVEWQADRAQAKLLDSWAPKAIVTSQFIVILSQSEPSAAASGEQKSRVALRNVAKQAARDPELQKSKLGEPHFVHAAAAVANEKALEDCVRALCSAKVVVFDATDFEPAIMFLAGIRAVVKRGVTLLSVGGNYALGGTLRVPFNVTDANIVAHSREQNHSTIANSVELLTMRIRRGIKEMVSTHYADLPVYDALRKLPADRRGIVPSEEGVLVLCPFEPTYTAFWDENLKQALTQELKLLRQNRELSEPAGFGISRSFELNSPRLVTHAVYEAIRRAQSCVIDLTAWSASVLFELGVRLAASGHRTSCIIRDGWEQSVREDWKAQCQAFVSMFAPEAFRYDATQDWAGQSAFSNAYGPNMLPAPSKWLDGGLHALIERVIDVDSEPASHPVFQELRDQAALFYRDPSGGRTKPVGLFPGNRRLREREETAEFERLMAAWLYIIHRYEREYIMADAELREACYSVAEALFERHATRLDNSTKSAAGEMMDRIDEMPGGR
jgi:hypothetical protein